VNTTAPPEESDMDVASFAEIEQEFIGRAHRIVWASVATVDRQGRPRSRVLHPIWEGQTGWITADPRSLKARHLALHPYASLAYDKDPFRPVYADCHAAWVEDAVTQQHVWDLLKNTPEPLGFDPGTIYSPIGEEEPDRPKYGVIKLTPYRITLFGFPDPPVVWTPEDVG
jgi:hypothetical protein